MSSITTCYICGKATPLKCMNPNCSHYFCPDHGGFMCQDCSRQSNQQLAQQQVVAVQRKETREGVMAVILGILGAIVVAIFTIIIEIIKAVFRQ